MTTKDDLNNFLLPVDIVLESLENCIPKCDETADIALEIILNLNKHYRFVKKL